MSDQPERAKTPAEQTLAGLGLNPVDGTATCPCCDQRSLTGRHAVELLCTGGCSPARLADALLGLAAITAESGLRILTEAMAATVRASGSGPGARGRAMVVPWPARPTGTFYGPLGEGAHAIEPLTEADPAAVLAQLLAAFGNAVGRGPRVVLGSIRQWANLFVVVVGKSSKSRKGTSWEGALEIIGAADTEWATDRHKSGLSSGEGVIHAVRDPLIIREPIREGGRKTGLVVDYQDVEQDPGVADKRLFVVEGEFARVLKVAERTACSPPCFGMRGTRGTSAY